VEGDDVLHLRPVGEHGIAIDFRRRNDEILVELVSLREFVGEPSGLSSKTRSIRRRIRRGRNISRNRQFYSLEVPNLAIVIWQSGK
jgi:hypothetical protein